MSARHERALVRQQPRDQSPAHYSGSVCGRGLSAVPASTVGFERRNNKALKHPSEEAFVEALVQDIPPAPDGQDAILAANRAGRPRTAA